MYSLLVVDDDYWMRKHLKENIPWADYNILLSGEAEDGEEAMEKLSQLNIDILIVDINLPGISGIDLVEIVIKQYPHIKIILISGYKEFEYARRAVGLGVLDYVLKPFEEEKLISVVAKAIKELDALKVNTLKIEKINRIADISVELLRKKFYEELISKDNDVMWVREKIDSLQLNLDVDDRYAVLILEIDNLNSAIGNMSIEEIYTLKSGIIELTGKILSNCLNAIIIESGGPRYAAIVSSGGHGNISDFNNILMTEGECVRKSVLECFNHTVTIGVGNICENIFGTRRSYENAGKILAGKFFAGNNRLLTALNNSGGEAGSLSYKGILKEIIEGIRKCDREIVAELLCKFKAAIKNKTGNDNNYIKRTIIHFIEEMLDQSGKSVLDNDLVFGDLNINSIIYGCETLDEIFIYLESILNLLINQVLEQRNNKTRNLVGDILKYIEENYSEDLYLDKIAAKVEMHPVYLCRVFKKETGENLIHYLMKFRIEKSKQLLCNPGIKIYEIALMVGYENMKTFSRIFKTVVGQTPKEFREKYIMKTE